jgi:hypothetical protein
MFIVSFKDESGLIELHAVSLAAASDISEALQKAGAADVRVHPCGPAGESGGVRAPCQSRGGSPPESGAGRRRDLR